MDIHAGPVVRALQISSTLVLTNGGFQFNVTATNLTDYVVETSSNITNWLALATNSLAASQFLDTNAAQYGRRFYRVRQLP